MKNTNLRGPPTAADSHSLLMTTTIPHSEVVGDLGPLHTRSRLRARDRYNSSTLIGGKGGAGPSLLLRTTLEGPMEYVNARWMYSLRGFLHGIEWTMFRDHLDFFRIHLLEVGVA